jgi:hypothetical protein
MGQGLRKVADYALSAGVILLAEQADVAAQADEPLKQVLRVGGTSNQDIGVGEPEATGKKSALAGGQAITGGRGIIPKHKSAARELSLDSLDSALDAFVV